MAYALIIMIAVVILILYVLKPGTTFNFELFGKEYSFAVTSTSTSGG